MILHADSHTDHVSQEILDFVLNRYNGRTDAFIETVNLPRALGTVDCGLYGPAMFDDPVSESEVHYVARPPRSWPSRLVDRPVRPVRKVTVVAGPYQGNPCVLLTVYGGPQAPREADDPGVTGEEHAESVRFWSQHALSGAKS